MKILYIHGANATSASFTFIREKLHGVDEIFFDYNAHDPIDDIVAECCKLITEPIHIIAHSLGGVIAVAVSQAYPSLVKSVTTLSTPFGGCESAFVLSMLIPSSVFFRNVRATNDVILDVQRQGAVVPTLNIITQSGNNPLMRQANDGVVSIQSQQALNNASKILVDLNHFEVLLSNQVVEYITYHFDTLDQS